MLAVLLKLGPWGTLVLHRGVIGVVEVGRRAKPLDCSVVSLDSVDESVGGFRRGLPTSHSLRAVWPGLVENWWGLVFSS